MPLLPRPELVLGRLGATAFVGAAQSWLSVPGAVPFRSSLQDKRTYAISLRRKDSDHHWAALPRDCRSTEVP